MDIWIQVCLYMLWNEQTDYSSCCWYFRLSEKAGGFLLHIFRKMESRIMKKIFKDHGYESLLPAGEASQDINRKEIE